MASWGRARWGEEIVLAKDSKDFIVVIPCKSNNTAQTSEMDIKPVWTGNLGEMVGCTKFSDLIKACKTACPRDPSSNFLLAVHFVPFSYGYEVFSSDGSNLHLYRTKSPISKGVKKGFMIGDGVVRFLKGKKLSTEAKIKIYQRGVEIELSSGVKIIDITKSVDFKKPFICVMEKANGNVDGVVVNRQSFTQCLREIQDIFGKKSKAPFKIEVLPDGKITVSIRLDSGNSKSWIIQGKTFGKPSGVMLMAVPILRALRHLSNLVEVTLSWRSPKDPVRIYDSKSCFEALTMPVK
jgi:hypothetical protein